MYLVNEDMSIYVTRGDAVAFTVTAEDQDGNLHHFSAGDTIRFTVVEKKACENVMLQKTFGIEADTTAVEIFLTEADTRIGEVISKPTDYWYEVELNPFTNPQTIIGYDEDGPRVFKLFPEGAEIEDIIDPEDIPIIDDELDLTSERPVQNQAIARAMISLRNDAETAVAEATEVAETALAIAKGKNQAHVFSTTADMNAWLSAPENAGKYNVGDNLYIVEVDVPDWWISEVLAEADPDTGLYYKVARLETQKVDLTNIEADIDKLQVDVADQQAQITEQNGKINDVELLFGDTELVGGIKIAVYRVGNVVTASIFADSTSDIVVGYKEAYITLPNGARPHFQMKRIITTMKGKHITFLVNKYGSAGIYYAHDAISSGDSLNDIVTWAVDITK